MLLELCQLHTTQDMPWLRWIWVGIPNSLRMWELRVARWWSEHTTPPEHLQGCRERILDKIQRAFEIFKNFNKDGAKGNSLSVSWGLCVNVRLVPWPDKKPFLLDHGCLLLLLHEINVTKERQDLQTESWSCPDVQKTYWKDFTGGQSYCQDDKLCISEIPTQGLIVIFLLK